jgi:hypothetical protein
MNVIRLVGLSSLSLLLLACTADTELPPERPVGTVSGKVIDGVIANAISRLMPMAMVRAADALAEPPRMPMVIIPWAYRRTAS